MTIVHFLDYCTKNKTPCPALPKKRRARSPCSFPLDSPCSHSSPCSPSALATLRYQPGFCSRLGFFMRSV